MTAIVLSIPLDGLPTSLGFQAFQANPPLDTPSEGATPPGHPRPSEGTPHCADCGALTDLLLPVVGVGKCCWTCCERLRDEGLHG
jgi:hypothetical protein